MTPTSSEQSDPATLTTAEGQAALGRGDTVLARTKFVEAGEILLRDIAGADKHSEKALLRFLVATQFYKGGEYRRQGLRTLVFKGKCRLSNQGNAKSGWFRASFLGGNHPPGHDSL